MAKASTLTDVANLALSSLGEKQITNIDTDGQLENTTRPILSESIRQVQQEIDWQELRVTYTPTHTGNTHPSDESLYEFNLPNNFLDMVEIKGDIYWLIEDTKLYTKSTSPVVTYKKSSEEVTEWSGYLTEMCYKRTALNLAMSLTQNLQIAQNASQVYELAKVNNLMKSSNRRRKEYTRSQDYRWRRIRRVRS